LRSGFAPESPLPSCSSANMLSTKFGKSIGTSIDGFCPFDVYAKD
jgi:hypothetical protein